MKQYIVIERPLRLHSGRVALGAEQARPRQHRLKAVAPGVYEVVRGPVEFKIGETIGLENVPSKALRELLVDPAGEKDEARLASAKAAVARAGAGAEADDKAKPKAKAEPNAKAKAKAG